VEAYVESSPPVEDDRRRAARQRMAAGLLLMGTIHFVLPKPFMKLIPSWLPGSARFWTYFSGAWELTSGALLMNPRTRRAGGYAAAATIVSVFPGNIKMAVEAGPPKDAKSIGAWLRLPMQVPMFLGALRHTRD
jgi:uncharacterized membrane protein